MKDRIVRMYTDGACRGNPGPGGWGVLLRYQGQERRMYGNEQHTTNNRMELMAAIAGLQALKRSSEVIITTDSQYVQRGVEEWLLKWKKNNWRTSQKKPVKNQDLWEKLDGLLLKHQVRWQWVRGHSGHPENELADQLANQGIDELCDKLS